MSMIASRELRNNTRQVLDRVSAGEQVTITVSGIPVALLVPTPTRRRWLNRQTFIAAFEGAQADSALRADLDQLVGDESTDDLRWP